MDHVAEAWEYPAWLSVPNAPGRGKFGPTAELPWLRAMQMSLHG